MFWVLFSTVALVLYNCSTLYDLNPYAWLASLKSVIGWRDYCWSTLRESSMEDQRRQTALCFKKKSPRLAASAAPFSRLLVRNLSHWGVNSSMLAYSRSGKRFTRCTSVAALKALGQTETTDQRMGPRPYTVYNVLLFSSLNNQQHNKAAYSRTTTSLAKIGCEVLICAARGKVSSILKPA